jgi:DNA mismatch repair protein MutS2
MDAPTEQHAAHAFVSLELDRALDLVCAYCRAPGGPDRVRRLVPHRRREDLEAHRRQVAELVLLLERGESLPLEEVPDLAGPADRLTLPGAQFEPAELHLLGRHLTAAAHVHAFCRQWLEDLPETGGRAGALQLHVELRRAIERCILPGGRIADEASGTLLRLRREIERARDETRGRLESLREERGLSDSELNLTLRNDRFVLPVPRSAAGSVEGIVHDRSSSGATLFIEPLEAVSLNNEVHRLIRDERREVERILQRLSGQARAAGADVLRNEEILGELDAFQAQALFARAYGGRAAATSEDRSLRIVRGRHPLLAHQYRLEEREREVVPLDLEMAEPTLVLVISGPNTGGKTVALKTVGLLSLLDQCGVPVPCEKGTSFPLFTGFYADIGDEQSIEDHVSTFASHVNNLRRVIDGAGPGSLILLDEVGGATDPEEGGALGKAVLEHLAGTGALTIVTTHIGSLKGFAHRRPELANASMEFDPRRGRPLYRLRVGIPGSSRGLATARALGLPEELVGRAEEHLGTRRVELDALLADLERERRELAKRNQGLERRLARLEESRGRLESLRTEVEEEKRSFGIEARKELDRFLAEARRTLEGEVRNLRSRGADRESNLRARDALEAVAERAAGLAGSEEQAGTREENEEFEEGQEILVLSLGSRGRVIEPRPGRERLLVEVGGLKLEVSRSDVRSAGVDSSVQWKERPSAGSGGPSFPVSAGYAQNVESLDSPSLSVRGFTREDALEAVDRFLDRAVLQGLGTVHIVHGVGEGVLRRSIRRKLDGDRRVASHRPGGWGEGEDGVTVVTLR